MRIGAWKRGLFVLLLIALTLFFVSCGDDDDGNANTNELPSTIRVELPCTGPGPDVYSCETNTDDVVSGVLLGEENASYDVTIRVRGVVEQKEYSDSTEVDGMWAKGGTPDGSSYNMYKLEISSPQQTYYVNYGTTGIVRCFELDVQKTVIVDEGATVELMADSGGDIFQIINRDSVDVIWDPIVIPGIPPDPDPFDGQFVQMDIISKVKR